MGGATKQLLSRGGEKKLGEKEERMEEWWSSRRGSSRRYIVVKFLFYFFFFREEKFRLGKALSLLEGGTSLSLSFSNFSFELKRRNETNPRK